MATSGKLFLTALILAALTLFFAPAVYAEDVSVAVTAVDGQTKALLEQSADLAGEPQDLAGVKVTEPTAVPTGFGLWWRDLREQVSLALTLDPVKKSEKALKYAEERVKLADYISQNGTDEKIREKAQAMIDKAGEYLEKIQANQAKILEKPGERAKNLMNNLTAHYANTEQVLEKMEDKVAPEKLENFQALRMNVETRAENFLDNLAANQNVPAEIKEKIIQVKENVAEKLKAREEFRAGQKEILEKAKTGDEQAKQELETIRREKLKSAEEARLDYKEKINEVVNQIKSGETDAAAKLKALNQERLEDLKQIRENFMEKAEAAKRQLQRLNGQSEEGPLPNRQNQPRQINEVKNLNQVKPANPSSGLTNSGVGAAVSEPVAAPAEAQAPVVPVAQE